MKIRGTGHALPERLVGAAEIDALLGLAAGSALKRNAVMRRGFAGPYETASALGAAALSRALDDAGMDIGDLDAILFASVMPEQPMPPTAVQIFSRLAPGEQSIACLDINASCLGFLRAMEIAGDAIASGRWRHVGIVCADLASKGLNPGDVDTFTLFGDGAGAAVAGPAEGGSTLLGSCSLTLPQGFSLSEIRAGGSRYNIASPPPEPGDYYFRMDGRGLLKLMSKHFPPFLDRCLALAGGGVDVVVPHQASQVGLAFIRRLLTGRGDPRFVDILAGHGNQVAASLPTALDIAVRDGAIARGDTVLLIGTAAGVSMAGLALRF